MRTQIYLTILNYFISELFRLHVEAFEPARGRQLMAIFACRWSNG